jgi:hypothetical protein
MLGATRDAKRSGSGRRRLSSVEVLQLLLPGLGTELEDVASGVAADAHDDVPEVLEGVDPVQLAGGEQRVQDAGSLGAVLAAGEEPILPTTATRRSWRSAALLSSLRRASSRKRVSAPHWLRAYPMASAMGAFGRTTSASASN